jgi:hypothetical protein
MSNFLYISALALWKREPWLAEFWSGVVSLAVSLITLQTPHMWKAMSRLNELADTEVWQAVAFTLGVLQLAALFVDRRRVRHASSVLMCWFWGTMTVGIWQGMPGASVACVCTAGYAGINVFSAVRLAAPHG